MWPNVKALQLVPLAAHALFARPLIIGAGSTFTLDILDDSSSEGWICCDGRRQCALPKGTRVEVRESKSTLRLARLSGVPFTNRLITAEWEDNDLEEGGQYLAELKIFADDRRGLLLDVSKVFTEEKIDVKSMNTRTSKKGTATMEMGFVVHGREELNRVIGKLRQIENVIDIERTTG